MNSFRAIEERSGSHHWLRFYFLFSLVCAFSIEAGFSEQVSLTPLWTVNTKTFLESAPTVADLDGDGVDEILVAGREEMIALSGSGEELWRWRTRGRFMTYPSVLTTGESDSLIYAGDTSKLLSCLNSKGEEVWTADLEAGSSWSAPVVCDLNSDGRMDLVQTDESGSVSVFDALTGEKKWSAKVEGKPVSPAVGDLDEDGQDEIVVSTSEGMLSALSAHGEILWTRKIGGTWETWAGSAPVMFRDSRGRGLVAVGTSDERVVCVDENGETIWSHPTRGSVAATLSVGDIDLDGRADVFLITQTGVVHRYAEDGQPLWEIDMQGRTLGAGALIDLDGEGALEYVLCTQDGHLMVLNADGENLFDYRFENRTINITPTFGELDPSTPGLEMAITGGETGKVFCFATSAPRGTVPQWGSYRGNVKKTGAWFDLKVGEKKVSMVLEDPSLELHTCDKPVRFLISNPDPGASPLQASAGCLRPDGDRQAVITSVIGGQGILELPLEVLTAGTYRFEWSVRDANGIKIFSDSRDVFFQPFMNERSAVAQALESLKETVLKVEEKFPASAKALLREANLLESTKGPVEALQDQAITNPDLAKEALDRTEDLVLKAAHLRRLSDTVARTTASGDITDLIVFEGQVWESREVGMEMPEHAGSPLVLHRRVVLGEHEPISLRVLNITDAEQTVRASIENQAEGIDCVLHRAVAVPTSLGEVSWDPLPKLDETQTFSVPSLSSREAWLDIHVGDVIPGSHTIEIDFQAITGTGLVGGPSNPHSAPTPKTKVRIELEVLPFTPAPSGAIRLCMWASLDEPAIQDLLAHGGNVFVVPHGSPIRDENKRIQEVDFTQIDALLEFLKGEDVILLLNGSPQNPYKIGTEEYESDLRSYLDLLIDHLADWGFDLNHFALYPHDEPGGIGWNAVNSLVEFGQVVKRINPKLMLYVDGGGEREMFEAMAPVIDIWTPSITMLREDTPEMRVIREDGGMLWSYDCVYAYARPVGANLKNISIIPQYRTAALFALRHDATGIGFWCYNIGESLWGRTLFEYPVVYEGQSGPVTSRRWEAIREGLEDFRILTALKQQSREGQLSEAVRDKIDHLLNVRLPNLVDPASDATVLGLGRSTIDQYLDAGELESFRIEMLDCVNALSTSGN